MPTNVLFVLKEFTHNWVRTRKRKSIQHPAEFQLMTHTFFRNKVNEFLLVSSRNNGCSGNWVWFFKIASLQAVDKTNSQLVSLYYYALLKMSPLAKILPHISRQPNSHYCPHNNPLPAYIVSQIKPVQRKWITAIILYTEPHLIQNKLLPIREAEQLMFFREIIAVYCDNRTKRNNLREHNVEFNIDYRVRLTQHYILIIFRCNMFRPP